MGFSGENINLKISIMKVKCNVCRESPIVELPKPEEDKMVNCPSCDKQLTYGFLDNHNKPYWSIIDSTFNKEWGGIPVEIIADNQRIVIGCNYHTTWQKHPSMRFVLSEITTSKLHTAVFDAPSVAVKIIFVVPIPTIVPGAGTCVIVTPGQLSAAIANGV